MANTNPQEQTSAWIFRRALKDNKKYKNAKEIWTDPTFQKEVIGTKSKPGIYPNVPEEWVENYYKQQNKFLDEFSDAKFTEFSLDQKKPGEFMQFVADLVKKKYGISRKDTWDPADVWCVQNQRQIIVDIKKVIDASKREPEMIDQLNSLLRTLFKERKVVGISLKLVGEKQSKARYQEVNIENGILFKSGKKPYFIIKEMICDLSITSTGQPKAKGSTVKLEITYTKETVESNMQFRKHPNSKEGGNLIFSFQDKGAPAQVGSVPDKKMELKLKNEFRMNFENDYTKSELYASNLQEFNSKKDTYVKMFNSIKTKVDTRINTDKEFVNNMILLLKSEEHWHLGQTKLMQLTFFSKFCKLSKESMNEAITELYFLAEKRGKGFGPFGKIY